MEIRIPAYKLWIFIYWYLECLKKIMGSSIHPLEQLKEDEGEKSSCFLVVHNWTQVSKTLVELFWALARSWSVHTVLFWLTLDGGEVRSWFSLVQGHREWFNLSFSDHGGPNLLQWLIRPLWKKMNRWLLSSEICWVQFTRKLSSQTSIGYWLRSGFFNTGGPNLEGALSLCHLGIILLKFCTSKILVVSSIIEIFTSN